MLHELADNWWLVLLRGIAAIAFGILAFFWPAIALVTLVFLWGTYAIVDGVFALAAAIAGVGGEVVPRWWLVLVGIAGILAGVLAFVWPDITAQVLLAFIAAWAIIIGVLQIVGAIQLRKGNRRGVAAGVERPRFDPLRHRPGRPAQRGCARAGLDDRFLRDRSRLPLHRAGVSPEAVQIAGVSRNNASVVCTGPLMSLRGRTRVPV